MDLKKFETSKYAKDIKAMSQQCDSLRKNPDNPIDVSFETFVKKKHNVSLGQVFEDIGIDPSMDTIENMVNLPDDSVRWLIPEIFRESLRLGMGKAPIWSNVVAAEQSVKSLSITIPHWNMSDATPAYVGVAETIPLGGVSFGQKTLKLRKIGKGVKIPYEVRNYVSINVVSIFLQDFGVKLGHAMDGLMIDTLINGEQADGSESAPVIGITTPGTLTYADILRIWIRMSRIGRLPTIMIGGETAALNTLNLPEFKTNQNGGIAAAGVMANNNIKLKTPIPASTDYYIHGSMPVNQQLIIDRTSTVIKYNAQPLLVESEKIVSNQTEATYATLTTGFGIVFRDGRVLLDTSTDFDTTNGFPTYMDVDALESVTIED
jgi:hypothetical protein